MATEILAKPTITRTIRISPELLERITVLAEKRKWSINGWIINTLERESKPRKR